MQLFPWFLFWFKYEYADENSESVEIEVKWDKDNNKNNLGFNNALIEDENEDIIKFQQFYPKEKKKLKINKKEII